VASDRRMKLSSFPLKKLRNNLLDNTNLSGVDHQTAQEKRNRAPNSITQLLGKTDTPNNKPTLSQRHAGRDQPSEELGNTAIAWQPTPPGPHARATTVSAPGRSDAVRPISNDLFARVAVTVPFQTTRRSRTSATRQAPGRAPSTSNRSSSRPSSTLHLNLTVVLSLHAPVTRTSVRPSLPPRAPAVPTPTVNKSTVATTAMAARLTAAADGRFPGMRPVCSRRPRADNGTLVSRQGLTRRAPGARPTGSPARGR